MFDHSFLVYAMIVVIPLTALVALAYAFLRAWRKRLRGLLVLLTVAAVGLMAWASSEGSLALSAVEARGSQAEFAAAWSHAEASANVAYATIGLLVVVLVTVWWVLRPDKAPTLMGHVAAIVLALAALSNIWALWTVAQAGFAAAALHS